MKFFRLVGFLALTVLSGTGMASLTADLHALRTFLEAKVNHFPGPGRSYLKVQRIDRHGIDFQSVQGVRDSENTQTTSFDWSNVKSVDSVHRRTGPAADSVRVDFKKSVDVILSEIGGGRNQTQHGLDRATTFELANQADAAKLKKLIERVLAEAR